MLSLPARTTVVEVGPRDGLQSLDRWIDTDTKVAMVDRLSDARLPVIEVTSFAHPRVVPMLTDAAEVLDRIRRRPGTRYRALVPNKRGALRAAEAKLDEMLGLMTVSATYLAKNQNMTLDEAIEQAGACFRVAEQAGQDFVMALGMAFFCPYEGPIPMEATLGCVERLRNAGIRRFYFAASTGMEDPVHVGALFARAGDLFPDCELGFHVHEKLGLAPANLVAALDAGAAFVEGSVCGIGGGIAFPGGVGSVGNLPTEDIVHFLDVMGVETGIDVDAMRAAATDIATLCSIEPTSRLIRAGTRADVMRLGRERPTSRHD